MLKDKKKVLKLAIRSIFVAALTLTNSCQRNSLTIPNELDNSNNFTSNTQTKVASSIDGQVVLKFKQKLSDASIMELASRYRAQVLNISTKLNSAVFQFQKGMQISGSIQELNSHPWVEYAEPNYRYSNFYTVRDPRSVEQNGLAVAGLAKAWDITHGDPRTVIAIVDTGVDLGHPDLKNKLVQGFNVLSQGASPPMDDNGHGTHCAGIAAAETDNGIGIAGASPRSKIMPVKALDRAGGGNLFDVSLGIVWAVDHGADIINLSLGGPDGETLRRAVDYALKKNTVVVTAMGNDGKNMKAYPAALPGVISVGSVDNDRMKSDFSNFGNWMSVMAPGRNIMSTLPTYSTTMTAIEKSEGYDYLDGTSMATPIVSGIVALMLSRNPNYTPAEVKARLESTATDLGDPGYDIYYGHGLVNAAKAVL